ncbi:MAG: hypothetical protein JWO25_1889 [Alphaproteobacteria bacterium]|nr:hypothetical protein [Alphaproteobacteria bacterium]
MRGTSTESMIAGAPQGVAFEPPANLEMLLARIAELSARLSRSVLADGEGEEIDQARTLARYALGARRRRDAHLSGLGMNEVQWMLLVELFVAESEFRPPASVTDVCQSVAAPKTTALRHLDRLTETGFVKRISHPSDKRSSHVALTERGRSLVSTHFSGEILRLRMSGVA